MSIHVEVVKWQTRQLEGLVLARACGFKSRLRHHLLFSNEHILFWNHQNLNGSISLAGGTIP